MSDSAEVIEAVWLTKDFPVCPLGFPLVGLHTDLLMFCSECGERAKKCVSVAGVGLQTDVNVVSLSLGGLALAGEEMYNRVKSPWWQLVDFIVMVTFACSFLSVDKKVLHLNQRSVTKFNELKKM